MGENSKGEEAAGEGVLKTLIIISKQELGWLIARFNPYCRHKAKGYDKVIVLCPPDERYIWNDFATDFIDIKRPDRADRWFYGPGKSAKIPKKILKQHPGCDRIEPSEKTCNKGKREFRKFGSRNGDRCDPYIVIHARSTEKYGQGNRNYSVKKFERIVRDVGYRSISIGTIENSHLVPGTEDARGISLHKLCNILANAKLVIGPSSGPLHLSHFCGAPILVWTYKRYEKAVGGNNRYRYEKKWRPFKDVPVTVVDNYGWDPPVKVLIKKIKKVFR